MPERRAAFFDLDRTLLSGASGPVISDALVAAGVIQPGAKLPLEGAFYRAYESLGETLPFVAMVRMAAAFTRGWPLDGVRRAAESAVEGLAERLRPYALAAIEDERRSGRMVVLSTTTPAELVEPFAAELGFDAVVATRYEADGGTLTGRLDGGLVWGPGKLRAVRLWSATNEVSMVGSSAYSDSVFDAPLLGAVGKPHAVNPDARLRVLCALRRWPIESWDRPGGVASVAGRELYHLLRPLVRPELMALASVKVDGAARVPSSGPVVLAANHRSYFDVVALAMLVAEIGRPARFLAKKELFDAPVVGTLARALGGIPVDRDSSPGEALAVAGRVLRAGEMVVILPQGTIPRGKAFFDPALKGRTGAVRLAAATGAPVVPVGIWGTEHVWPRSARLPSLPGWQGRPEVTVRVGEPMVFGRGDARAGTDRLMHAIAGLLPEEARRRRVPSAGELARAEAPGAPSKR